jgi:hypothetical protein
MPLPDEADGAFHSMGDQAGDHHGAVRSFDRIRIAVLCVLLMDSILLASGSRNLIIVPFFQRTWKVTRSSRFW